MRSRVLLVLIFASIMPSVQAQDQKPIQSDEKVVNWNIIQVPMFPPLARQARIFGTVAIEVQFKGCQVDPNSVHVTSGHPMLVSAAVAALQHSTIYCGIFRIRKQPFITSSQ